MNGLLWEGFEFAWPMMQTPQEAVGGAAAQPIANNGSFVSAHTSMAFADADEFYTLARTCLVKDEKHFDRFDLAFGHFMQGIEEFDGALEAHRAGELAILPPTWISLVTLSHYRDVDEAMSHI